MEGERTSKRENPTTWLLDLTRFFWFKNTVWELKKVGRQEYTQSVVLHYSVFSKPLASSKNDRDECAMIN